MTEFTPKQNLELDDRAEKRDLDRTRVSVFSDQEVKALNARDNLRGLSSFSADQLAEIEQLSEARDLSRPRRSTFSIGEQKELDETARNLRREGQVRADNLRAENEANLTHRFNKIRQTELAFRFRRRFLPYVISGLLIALGAIDYVIQDNQSTANRAAIISLCHQQHLGSCPKP